MYGLVQDGDILTIIMLIGERQATGMVIIMAIKEDIMPGLMQDITIAEEAQDSIA